MLRVYLVVVITTAVLAIGSVVVTMSRVENKSELAAGQADAAVSASQISLALRDSVGVMFLTAYSFFLSGQLDSLPPETRQLILENAILQAENIQSPLRDLAVPSMTIPISDASAFELQSGIEAVSHDIDHLLTHSQDGVDLTPIAAERDRLLAALERYVQDNSATAFRDTFTGVVALGTQLSEASDGYNQALADTQSDLASATSLARYTMIGALVVLLVVMIVATVYVSRLIQTAFKSSESERMALLSTTETLQYRNNQLNALYNVFSEITDTLSMRYVISATLRETLRVMKASVVTIRLLRGSQLVNAGALTSGGRTLDDLPPIPLGEGPMGRVARRGRSMRIDAQAQEMIGPPLDPDDPEGPLQSGIVVPLIVGARVVGTLSCWSHEANAFHEQDERVLEMMASQVATAVIAADTQETLERRALSDPLTNLPNRRQLSEDMTLFGQWRRDGMSAVVAMLDIDHFKQINDDFGHKVGDVTLQKVASVMRQAIRDEDRIYRYGGEEFVIVFPGASQENALTLTERVLKSVAETPLTGEQLEPVGPVTISAGLAIMPDHGDEVAELMVLADRALYRAKQSGRNRIAVWDESLERPVEQVA